MRYIAIFAKLLVCVAAATSARAAPINDLPAPIVTRQAVFSIPFTVPALSVAEQPAEVWLLASGNRGGAWQVTEKVDLRGKPLPFRGGFTFRAPADGEYWFAIRTADGRGQMKSATIEGPELRVAVDTRPPRLDLSASRGADGEIVVRWQTVDPNLKVGSLALQYQSTGNPRWQSIAIDPSAQVVSGSTMSSTATWWPVDASGVVTIKAEVSDTAGNAAAAQAQVDLRQGVQPSGATVDGGAAPLTTSMNRSPTESADRPFASTMSRPGTSPIGRSQFDAREEPKPTAGFSRGTPWPADGVTDLPLGRGRPAATPGGVGAPRVEEVRGEPTGDNVGPIEGPALGPSTDGRIRPSGQRLDRAATPADTSAPRDLRELGDSPIHPPVGNRFIAPANEPQSANATQPSRAQAMYGDTRQAAAGSPVYFDRGGSGAAASQDLSSPRMPRASGFNYALPPGEQLRMVNSTTFELDYDIESIGRSGVAKVELWMTRDGGRTWTSMGVDSDNRSPFRSSVDGEGVYGYRMTVESGSGLSGRPPQSGDLPEVWIGVDLTRPSARLVSAEPGVGERAGEVIIRYEAGDAQLARGPITLSRSTQPGGPWTTIAAGLENTGQYSWRFDSSVPDRVYLRLEVRDEAGNTGTFEAADPISLERVLPQGRLRDVRPVGDSAGLSRCINIG